MKTILRIGLMVAGGLVVACDGGGSEPDASVTRDSGVDSGVRRDAGGRDAGGGDDAGGEDAAIADAGADGGSADAGTRDAGGSDAGTDGGTPARILLVGDLRSGSSREFSAASFRALLASRGTVTEMGDVTLTATLLDGYDLLVLADPANDITTSERTVLRVWVGTRGRVLALSGYSGDGQARANGVAQAITPEMSVMTTGELTNGATSRFLDPDSRLPTPLATPSVVGGYRLSLSASSLVADEVRVDLSGALVGASFLNPSGGRAFFWADEYASLDAGWSPSTEAFWDAVLDYLLVP